MFRVDAGASVTVIVALPMGRTSDHRGYRGVYAVIVRGTMTNLAWTLVVGRYFSSFLFFSLVRELNVRKSTTPYSS